MKVVNANGKVPNKALHSRVSFLFQAASFMATQKQNLESSPNEHSTKHVAAEAGKPTADLASNSISRRLASELRAVSLKAQLRISPSMKHAICKNCDTVLIERSTCTNEMENKSKGGKKPWADVLVRKCHICGVAKRYPLTATRQKRRHLREKSGDMLNDILHNE